LTITLLLVYSGEVICSLMRPVAIVNKLRGISLHGL